MSKSTLNEAFVLALISLAGYVFALMYEQGYADYFDIDQEFVVIDYQRILVSIAAVLSTLFVLLYLASFLVMHHASEAGTRKSPWRVGAIIASMFIPAYLIILFIPRSYAWIAAIAVTAILLSHSFLPTLWPSVISWLETKTKPNENSPRFEAFVPILPVFQRLFSWNVAIVVGITPGLLTLSWLMGHTHASRRTTYPLLQDGTDRVIVRLYGSNAILAKCDIERGEFAGNYQVVPLSALADIQVREVKLGSRRVQQPSTNRTTSTVN